MREAHLVGGNSSLLALFTTGSHRHRRRRHSSRCQNGHYIRLVAVGRLQDILMILRYSIEGIDVTQHTKLEQDLKCEALFYEQELRSATSACGAN